MPAPDPVSLDTAGGGAAALPERSAIPAADRWRLEDIYAERANWEADFAAVQAGAARAAAFRGRLAEGAEVLLQALTAQDEAGQGLERLFAYAHMRGDEDTRVAEYQAMSGRVGLLASQVEEAWAFLEPELLALPEAEVRSWCAEPPSAAAGLAVFRHRLDNLLRQKPHVLSAPEEGLLAAAGEIARTPETVFGMLNDADLTFPDVHDEQGREVPLSKGRFVHLLESPSRAVRQEAFETLYATYARQRHTLGALLGASLRRDWFYARARRYSSSLQMALDADNVPTAVYDQLIAAVRASLPALHRYLRLRRRVLGLERLRMYDLYVPLLERPESHISYAEAVATVERGLAPLGEDYLRRYRQGVSAGWVDVYENRGKAGGAYSWGVYGVHPFVLLNYQGSIDHVFTLAHEFGHAVHSQLAAEAQPHPCAGHSIFVAEVASTTNEVLLMRHLLEQARDRRQRAYLVNHHLEEFRTTVFRQVMFAEFERTAHAAVEAGEAPTADSLSAAYRELNLAYYGPEVELDPQIDLEWARIPHFYNAFYVYKYATGFSAAQALAEAVLRDGAPARERYLDLLRAGASRYPVELLAAAGVDMASRAPVEAALAVFSRLVAELEDLLD